jgi:hypothetical protein
VTRSIGANPPDRLRVVAIVAGGFGLVVTPFLVASWQAETDWFLIVGRMHFLAYIGALAGMLHFRRGLTAKPVFWGRLGFWIAFGALCLGLLGDAGAFWSDDNNFSKTSMTTIQVTFFVLDLSGAIIAQIALIYYGLGLVWSGVVRDRFGWWLAALAAVGLPLSILMFPSLTIFATTAFWVAAAVWQWPAEPDPVGSDRGGVS